MIYSLVQLRGTICIVITCEWDDLEARGQTGQLQSWTEMADKVIARVEWKEDTIWLQKPKDRLGKRCLTNNKSADQQTTAVATNLTMYSFIHKSPNSPSLDKKVTWIDQTKDWAHKKCGHKRRRELKAGCGKERQVGYLETNCYINKSDWNMVGVF